MPSLQSVTFYLASDQAAAIVTLSADLGRLAILSSLARLFRTLGDREWGGGDLRAQMDHLGFSGWPGLAALTGLASLVRGSTHR